MEILNSFAEEKDITFPLIPDLDGKLKTLYSKKRINYLIDRSGTIQMIQNGVPKNEYFIEKIRALEE
jgi:peroxiredoxin